LLSARLADKLDGPVVELGLKAACLVPLRGKQLAMFELRERHERLRRLAQEIEVRMGQPMLLRVEALGASVLPERRFEFVPV
jgi:hypothetical protein